MEIGELLSTIGGLIVVLLIAITFIGMLSVPLVIIYLIYGWLTKKGYKILGVIFVISSLTYILYSGYTAVFPRDNFYAEEFEDIAGFTLPEDAKIINKEASYPDFHGDYCSAAVIELNEDDYNNILKQVKKDARFDFTSTIIGNPELDRVTNGSNYEFSLKASRHGKPDEYFFIGFIAGSHLLIINKCIT